MATYWSDMCWKKTCLYRILDKDGDLLYVGISTNPEMRMYKHKRHQPWWSEVDGVTYEWFPDRSSAQAAERSAIHHEDPAYNVVRPRMECC